MVIELLISLLVLTFFLLAYWIISALGRLLTVIDRLL